ncbi:MAG: recombinase zinc beta ribbon domain-containing protein [Phycisphaeraceae bacterium]|nr:recombinase zinc beta ribbon domain-containing protein [Phycisphaeraceae bacterium]
MRCKACGCAMSHHFATDGPKRYRYYVCVRAQKRGCVPSISDECITLAHEALDEPRGSGHHRV